MSQNQLLSGFAGIGIGILLAWALYSATYQWAYVLVLGAVTLAIASAMIWWWFPTVGRRRVNVLASIMSARAAFDEAIERSKAIPPVGANIEIAAIHGAFDELRTKALALDVNTEALDVIEESAGGLSHLRAYLYPKEALVPEAKLCLATLKEWGVPGDVVTNLERDLLPRVEKEDTAGREALRAIFEEYDSWSDYVDWYNSDYMPRLNILFLLLVTIAIALALSRFVRQDVILGFVFAGISGALVSVLTRLPKFGVYGELSPALLGIFSRVGTGLVATAIGVGLLASGIFTITLPQGSAGTESVSLPKVIENCGRPKPAALTPAPQPPKPSVECTTGNLFTLLAIGILLGFSERALPAFEDKLFPGSKSSSQKQPEK